MAWRFIILFSISIQAYAQYTPAALRASLRTAARESNLDSLSYYSSVLGWYYLDRQNFDSANYFYRQALKYYRATSNPMGTASTLNNLGVLFYRTGSLDSSIDYYSAAHNEYQALKDTANISILEINLGMLFKEKGLYEKALAYLLNASYKLEKSEPSINLAACYNSIGNLYFKLKEARSSLDFHYKAVAVRKKLNLMSGLSASYNNIGNVYVLLNQYDSALINFQRCMEIKRALKDKNGEGVALNNIGELMIKMGRTADAEDLCRQALKLRLRTDDRVGQVITRNNLARVYLLADKPEAAERELELSEKLAIDMGLQEQLRDNYEIHVELLKDRKDYEQALVFSEKLLTVKDSLLNREKAQSLAEMQTRYESLKKEDRIALLEKEGLLRVVEIERKQIWIRSLTLAVVLTLIIGVLIYYNFRIVRKNKLHIELLLKELHHRVKNNLQILSSLLSLQSQQLTDDTAIRAVKSSESRINAMALIHRKLYTVDQNRTVDIKEYITELIQYLVYSYGYHEKNFKLDLDINEISIDVDKAIPLGLILNELISNAFKHAFQNQPNPVLKVGLAYPDIHELNIHIRDNGAGLTLPSDNERKTFGMKIVSTLIKELKGTLDVKSENGTVYNLHIPI